MDWATRVSCYYWIGCREVVFNLPSDNLVTVLVAWRLPTALTTRLYADSSAMRIARLPPLRRGYPLIWAMVIARNCFVHHAMLSSFLGRPLGLPLTPFLKPPAPLGLVMKPLALDTMTIPVWKLVIGTYNRFNNCYAIEIKRHKIAPVSVVVLLSRLP